MIQVYLFDIIYLIWERKVDLNNKALAIPYWFNRARDCDCCTRVFGIPSILTPIKGAFGQGHQDLLATLYSILGIIDLCNPLFLLSLLLGIILFELLLRLQLPSSSPLLRFASTDRAIRPDLHLRPTPTLKLSFHRAFFHLEDLIKRKKRVPQSHCFVRRRRESPLIELILNISRSCWQRVLC